MLGSFRKFSSSLFAKIFLFIVAIPFVFWGMGGVFSGADAYEKIRAGASAVQIYTALIYEGPGLVKRVKQELAELLERDEINSVKDVIGIDS